MAIIVLYHNNKNETKKYASIQFPLKTSIKRARVILLRSMKTIGTKYIIITLNKGEYHGNYFSRFITTLCKLCQKKTYPSWYEASIDSQMPKRPKVADLLLLYLYLFK